MIEKLRLLRNIGQFDSVNSGANIPLARLTLVYAENGRGKTTLAAILRSLATGDPIPITERHRLDAQHPPQVVLDCDGGPPAAMFQNNAWNRTLPNMTVFDDIFIDQNVCSGLTVATGHRQNLHELILGAQGVALSQQIQALVARIETHNTALRVKGAAIPTTARGNFSVDDFCSLPARSDIDAVIQETERALAAAREEDRIRSTPPFEALSLPSLDIEGIEEILHLDLPSLDAAAVEQVQNHLSGLGRGGEAWVADGMQRLSRPPQPDLATCPFCVQDLRGAAIIDHYRAYFGLSYKDLKTKVAATLTDIKDRHKGEVLAAFERMIRVAGERRQFWAQFCDVPDITVDTATVVRGWRAATEAVTAVLEAKHAAPLERMTISSQIRAAISTYEAHRQALATLNHLLQQSNTRIQVVKEQAAASDPDALATDLSRFRAIKIRHTSPTAELCADYLDERDEKRHSEQLRDQAKAELERYRTGVFPGYETAINLYLGRFNAGFRLDSVNSANTRSGPVCSYNVIINDIPVPVSGGSPAIGEPSFRNTLSAGDRNTLALAFFFASLDQDPQLTSKVIVIDDPMSSLDEHRSLTTVQQIRRLAERAGQVIVLSHNRPFLCRIWEGSERVNRTALQVVRDSGGSTLSIWDVDDDCITEHDRRHALLRDHLSHGQSDHRDVARSIRPLLEAFLRVAHPEHFPPGTLLGPFRHLCEQRVGSSQEILSTGDVQELRDLIEYSNRFHHDTNPAWETEVINDGELTDFVRRALSFARR